MRLSIFRKAEGLQTHVIEQGSIKDKAYFTFKDIDDPPLITLALEDGKYTYWESCTCTSCSIHTGTAQFGGKHPWCAYQSAVDKYLGKKVEENPQK